MMDNEKEKSSDKKSERAEEPTTAYKTIRIFTSHEEAAEYEAKQSAELTYDERLKYVEELRKRVFYRFLLDDGTWASISEKFRIMKPYTHDTG